MVLYQSLLFVLLSQSLIVPSEADAAWTLNKKMIPAIKYLQ